VICFDCCRTDCRCVGQGSVSQTDIAGGGMQCACVALAFLDLHQSNVIDEIQEVGTELYKLHFPGQSRYLLVSELPLTVDIKGNVYHCAQSSTFSGLVDIDQTVEESLTLSLADALARTFLESSSCLLTLGCVSIGTGFTIAVVKQTDKLLSFYSHSRCQKNLLSASGTAVVMEASGVTDFVVYVRDLIISFGFIVRRHTRVF